MKLHNVSSEESERLGGLLIEFAVFLTKITSRIAMALFDEGKDLIKRMQILLIYAEDAGNGAAWEERSSTVLSRCKINL